MEQERAMDRLALVSKVFMDARVAALRKENEELRLQLFWKDHKIQKLKQAIKRANFSSVDSIKCNCWKCSIAGRMDKGIKMDQNKTCKFIPWFQEIMAECGLIYESLPETHSHTDHPSDTSLPVCNVDSHFVETALTGGFLFQFTYGSKLWKAKSTDNPEIKKLEKLFGLLNSKAFSARDRPI
jgi:hypothetical protein